MTTPQASSRTPQTGITGGAIIGAMMSAIFEAELVFFNTKGFKCTAHPTPNSAAHVLAVTEEVRAGCATAPAAALLPFLQRREKVDLFIVVTDEEENCGAYGKWLSGFGGGRCRGGAADGSFCALWERYTREVHEGAKLTFVSFLSRAGDEGKMVRELRAAGFEPKQMRMDPARPDLSKFDAIVGSVMLDAQQAVAAQREAADRAVAGAA